ncbi:MULTISPECIES: hypothetical protein [Clostridium]|uniref:phage major capsid protein n=1 Tax=Clostridium TaxID=1485 RepID=UPI00082437EB|nr:MULTISPECIES: hypothetical protein [Clostridium]PJI07664.1 hypothetical protein CUB90_07210 [Clostridium sp. CT7]
MAFTGSMRADMLIPEVYTPFIEQAILTNSVMLGFADINNDLQGQPGDSITIPKWSLGSSAIILTEGDSIPYDKLVHTTQKIELQQFAKGFQITDRALLASYGDPVGEMAKQIGQLIAEKLDDTVVSVAGTTPLVSNCASATTITAAEVDTALNLYGDKQNISDFEGIIINPKLKSAFINMPEFVNSTNTTVTKDNGIIKQNIIGDFRGISVILSSKGTWDATNSQCVTYIIKKGSLLVPYKRHLNTEQARDIDTKSTKINADLIAGVGLVNDAGIVAIKSK